MLKKMIVVVVGAVLIAIPGSTRTEQKKDDPFKKLMMEKLVNAQKILEGTVTNDFTKVTAGAERLMQISNRAEWFALKTIRYKLYSNEFRRHLENIIKKAKQKNIDGVALGYVEMTMTCVRCHQYVRDVAEVSIEEPILFTPNGKMPSH